MLLFILSASGKERTYTGSTPANAVIRAFIGIPLVDSIDFIRWKFILFDDRYELQCNYGISKANTNGFINGGATVELRGACKKEGNYYHCKNGTKTLKAVEINADLLHLLNEDNSPLVGNGGWSYTFNNITPSGTNGVSMMAATTVLKDSMAFEGRTPCNVPGVIEPGRLCYKIKWSIVFYANAKANEPVSYKVRVTPWRKEGSKTGTWQIITGPNERTLYRLNDEKGIGLLYLLKLDEHILVFTDAQGKPLVGNEDFSYTLNSRW